MSAADSPFSSLTPARKQLGLGASYCRHDLRRGDQTADSCLMRLPHPHTYKDPPTRDMRRDTHMPTYMRAHTHTLRIGKKRPLLLTPRQTQALQNKSEWAHSSPVLLSLPPCVGFSSVPLGPEICARGPEPGYHRDTTRLSALCGVGGTAWWFDYFFFSFLKKFLYFWLRWVSLAQALSSCGGWASHCGGFSCCGAQALGAHGLQRSQLPGSRARAQLLRSMWDLPGPGIEPVSPALADRLLSTAPVGKS